MEKRQAGGTYRLKPNRLLGFGENQSQRGKDRNETTI